MGSKPDKTNVMRILDSQKIEYNHYTYDSALLNGVDVARSLGKDPGAVFKTLVTVGKTGEHYVFMLPAAKELDLKKASSAAGEKFLEMLPQKELLPLTGYIHGGCSPIGMKKRFRTFIDVSAEVLETLCFSGGHVGCQVEMKLCALQKVINAIPADVAK